MKRKPTPLSSGKNMMITEYYKCKFCRQKVMHIFRGSHLLQHTEKLYPTVYIPLKNR